MSHRLGETELTLPFLMNLCSCRPASIRDDGKAWFHLRDLWVRHNLRSPSILDSVFTFASVFSGNWTWFLSPRPIWWTHTRPPRWEADCQPSDGTWNGLKYFKWVPRLFDWLAYQNKNIEKLIHLRKQSHHGCNSPRPCEGNDGWSLTSKMVYLKLKWCPIWELLGEHEIKLTVMAPSENFLPSRWIEVKIHVEDFYRPQKVTSSQKLESNFMLIVIKMPKDQLSGLRYKKTHKSGCTYFRCSTEN